ncbi:hypothetical protein IGB42_00194 [Andreprevotia sp. IGB-42]|uniref:hypothetical protein n=1 Tax=Andreprevotia sp. IGB-42 TaxID=2497473 RepID=UPI00135C7CF2|nr:hypothetical protein [Andreprevotia sp. IGB-42]KAF0815117.1 hypothetical protein IGB42_00194 [Andreprevotia sp. IGB-42]
MLIRHATSADAIALLDLYDEYERPADQRPGLAVMTASDTALAPADDFPAMTIDQLS